MLRQLGGRLRRVLYRLASPVDRLLPGRRESLLPPAYLRAYYYGTTDPQAFRRACERAKIEITAHGFQPHHRILDVGSGIGNLAIALLDCHQGGYAGIEIHPDALAWCQRTITRRFPGFRFHRADLASRAYNPTGQVRPSAYRFPFDDGTFDVVFLGSIFTHMLPDAVEHYVHEIARVLKPGGMCVESYFLLNDSTRPSVEGGLSFMKFQVAHSSGVCRLHDAAVPESAVAIEETFIRRIHAEAGLRLRDIRGGGWWSGAAHDQDVIVAVRPAP